VTYIRLDYLDVALASVLVLMNGGLSVALHLGLERQLAIATVRMVVQLILVGLVLTRLFELVSPLWTGLAALVMVLFAGREIAARQERPLAGPWAYGLGTGCMLIAATVVTGFGLSTQVSPDPWYDPRYALPLLGMILGNTMTGISLGLNTLTTGVVRDRAAVEARLALMPIVNSMAATGLVSLPGMMTGQILAGVEPVQAVKYQLLIMFLIAGGTGLGALAAILGGVQRLTDRRHRLRLDRLATKR
jgi:putative ABC transport system permease protein